MKLVVVVQAVLLAAIALPAHADDIFSDGFEASGTCLWSFGPCGRMLDVPAGPFTMGDTAATADQPVHTVTLSAYQIDQTLVTVDQYAACMQDGGCVAPDSTYAGFHLCNSGAPWSPGNHPINCVDWDLAASYCAWAGKRYPTEAEWEKAARGTDARSYPWGEDTATCSFAVMSDPNAGGNACGLNHTAAVGSIPAGASPYGALDMAGDVWEWVADWYDPAYYAVSPSQDPTGPASSPSGLRGLRGGAWANSNPLLLRAPYRYGGDPSVGSAYVGFRCARGG